MDERLTDCTVEMFATTGQLSFVEIDHYLQHRINMQGAGYITYRVRKFILWESLGK